MLYYNNIVSLVFLFICNAFTLSSNMHYTNYFIYTLPNLLIEYLFSLMFFILMERIHTSFYYMTDIIIYVIYCVFEFELKQSYQNLMFLTIGLTFFVTFFSFLVTYFVELNIRKVIKGFQKKDSPAVPNNSERTLSEFSMNSL